MEVWSFAGDFGCVSKALMVRLDLLRLCKESVAHYS